MQASTESEMSAGQLRDAEAASEALQEQLKQLEGQQAASARQAQDATISQEDADGETPP